MAWSEVRKYNTSNTEGDVETVILEKDGKGNFRIRNDFGNNVFEFDRMSAYEVFKKINKEISDDLEDDLNNSVWGNYQDNDSEEPTIHDYDDCDYTD